MTDVRTTEPVGVPFVPVTVVLTVSGCRLVMVVAEGEIETVGVVVVGVVEPPLLPPPPPQATTTLASANRRARLPIQLRQRRSLTGAMKRTSEARARLAAIRQ